MTHITNLIHAYHDGELSQERVHQVEAHLAGCADCRRELEALQALSLMLQEDLIAAQFTPADRFAAEVAMQLPRRPLAARRQKLWQTAWKAIPVGLAGAWGFVQAVFLMAFLLFPMLQSGVFSSVMPFLPEGSSTILSDVIGFASAPGLEEIGRLVLRLVTFSDPAVQSLLIYLFLQFVIGLLFCAWLATWWLAREKRSAVRLIINH